MSYPYDKDVECPYCGKWQDINHDDGYGYEEDEPYEQECEYCEKMFVYYTSTHYHYSAHQADCLNGGEHKFAPTKTYPVEYTRMRCADCELERELTDDEWRELDLVKEPG